MEKSLKNLNLSDPVSVSEMEKLRALAMHEIEQFWEWHHGVNCSRPYKDRSVLGVRMRQVKGSPSMSIEWFEITWAGKNRNMRSRYLNKGRGNRYPNRTLKSRAGELAWPVIDEYETKFAQIRAAARQLVELRQAWLKYQKAVHPLTEQLQNLPTTPQPKPRPKKFTKRAVKG